MITTISKYILLSCTTIVLFSLDLPKGWQKRGSMPDSYEMGIEQGAGYKSKNAATIKSINNEIDGFGTLSQYCRASQYAGKRIRMTSYMKTKDADTGWLWLRVDAVDTTAQTDSVTIASLALDNMQERPIKGTTDWAKYEIVLDVPLHATHLAFGGALSRTGQIWFDDLSFGVVDNNIPNTSTITLPEGGMTYKMERGKFRNWDITLSQQPAHISFED